MTFHPASSARYTRVDMVALLNELAGPAIPLADQMAPADLMKVLLDAVGREVDRPGFQGRFDESLLDSLRDLHRFLTADLGSTSGVDPILLGDTVDSMVKAFCYQPGTNS